MITSSPIVVFFCRIVALLLVINRVMFTIATYKKIQIERQEDLFLKQNFCNTLDHREMGRHTAICLEADRRLASPIIFHTLQSVVDDTLYRELHFHTIAQITAIFSGVIIIGALHSKYIKDNQHMNLPMTSKVKLM